MCVCVLTHDQGRGSLRGGGGGGGSSRSRVMVQSQIEGRFGRGSYYFSRHHATLRLNRNFGTCSENLTKGTDE